MPPGLPVTITYNGSLEPPDCAGTYEVEAHVVDPNYDGFAAATLLIREPMGPAILLSWPPAPYDVVMSESIDLITWTTRAIVVPGSSNSLVLLGQSVAGFFYAVSTSSHGSYQLPLRIQKLATP
jgi:hypothetical protein